MNQLEIQNKVQNEIKEKTLAQLETKQVVKRGRKAAPKPVIGIEKPQAQTVAKKAIPQDLEYLESELNKIFSRGSFDIDVKHGVVNFRGGKKIHECEPLGQPAQILIRCAQTYIHQSFGNFKAKANPLITGVVDEDE